MAGANNANPIVIGALLRDVQETDLKVSFGDLEVGVLYPVRQLTRTNTMILGKKGRRWHSLQN